MADDDEIADDPAELQAEIRSFLAEELSVSLDALINWVDGIRPGAPVPDVTENVGQRAARLVRLLGYPQPPLSYRESFVPADGDDMKAEGRDWRANGTARQKRHLLAYEPGQTRPAHELLLESLTWPDDPLAEYQRTLTVGTFTPADRQVFLRILYGWVDEIEPLQIACVPFESVPPAKPTTPEREDGCGDSAPFVLGPARTVTLRGGGATATVTPKQYQFLERLAAAGGTLDVNHLIHAGTTALWRKPLTSNSRDTLGTFVRRLNQQLLDQGAGFAVNVRGEHVVAERE